MPNTTVPATAEGMPKFDLAAIMSDAWERWRVPVNHEARFVMISETLR